jgi:3-oxoadipate enol-lactonase
MPKINVNGANIHYEESGQGEETIVFSHGLLWSSRMFDNQVAVLKDNYRVITYDHRGQGQSEVTESGYDMDTLTDDAIALIETLNLGKVHFVGLSMGGFVAMRIAARRSDLVKSMILIETSAEPEPKENVPKYKMLSFVARWLGFTLVTKSVMEIMFGQTWRNDSTRADEHQYWKQQLHNNDRIGVTRAVKGVVNRKGVVDELSNITAPTLILVGEEDVATVPAKAEAIHKAIPQSKLVYIPQAGHTSSVENPSAVNQAITDFLA